MESYASFASVYDRFMDNIPYEEWFEYLHGLLKEYKIEEGLLLDLGCGTGNMTEILGREGYDMIGIDNSPEMLEIAMKKETKELYSILYLLQDMRAFELYGTVKGVVSICDSINYITDEEELVEVFRLVNNYLDPGGFFIFDFNTTYKYREILGEQTIAENRDDCSFIWENYYDEEEEINEYELTLFIQDQKTSKFDRYQETHYQRAFTLEKIIELLGESGLEYVVAYEAFTKEKPSETSERIYVIAKENGKEL